MIAIGDVVQVNKDDAGMNFIMRAEVLSMPRGEGDGWAFLNLDNGTEVWTSERITVYKRTPKQEDTPDAAR